MDANIIPYLCIAITAVTGALVWYVKSTRAREDKAIKRQEDREDKTLKRKEDREDDDRNYSRKQDSDRKSEILTAIGSIDVGLSEKIEAVSVVAQDTASELKQVKTKADRNEKEIDKLRDKIK